MCESVLLSYSASLSYEPTTFIEDITVIQNIIPYMGRVYTAQNAENVSKNILETEHFTIMHFTSLQVSLCKTRPNKVT